jgi:hypothetical protein
MGQLGAVIRVSEAVRYHIIRSAIPFHADAIYY